MADSGTRQLCYWECGIKIKPRVLFIEDSPEINAMLGMFMNDEVLANTAELGKTALDLYKEGLVTVPFKLIVCDIALPDMSGFEIVEQIRHYEPCVPIIMYTAYEVSEAKPRAAAFGVNEVLSKATSLQEFRAVIRSLLNEAHWKSEGC